MTTGDLEKRTPKRDPGFQVRRTRVVRPYDPLIIGNSRQKLVTYYLRPPLYEIEGAEECTLLNHREVNLTEGQGCLLNLETMGVTIDRTIV